jgi:DNA-binding response OmpR family regulator
MPLKFEGRSIIVIEDEPLIALDSIEAFREAGADVTMTTTLKQALILVEHDGLSCAIVDHALKDGNSTRLCERLKERNIPFVMFSGLDEFKGACAGTLVPEPASMDVLTAAVEKLLST